MLWTKKISDMKLHDLTPGQRQHSLFDAIYTEGANKHTSCHHELAKDEVWLGNTGTEIPGDFRSLKTIRLGEQAYDITGKPLRRDYMRPLIIKKSEFTEYERIYSKRMAL